MPILTDELMIDTREIVTARTNEFATVERAESHGQFHLFVASERLSRRDGSIPNIHGEKPKRLILLRSNPSFAV